MIYTKRAFIALCVLFTCLFACSDTDDEVLSNGINIRVLNLSNYTFKNISVKNPMDSVVYGNLRPGQSSRYKVFQDAYMIAHISLAIDNDIYQIRPIDYVGEPSLEAGRYTYVIQAKSSGSAYNRLSLTFIEDE